MKPLQLIAQLKQSLSEEDYTYSYNRETNSLKLTHKRVKRTIDLALGPVIAKYGQKQDKAIDEVIYMIRETFDAMEQEQKTSQYENPVIYPIIRATSFPVKSKKGVPFITKGHTSETRIFYALDLGTTYRLIDEELLEKLQMTEQQVTESALFQLRNLPTHYKVDEVAGNKFYFFNANDGYDASRILNDKLMKEMQDKVEGEMTLAVPHQDVLIIGDIRNDAGYDILAQMTMHFFTVGIVPVTSLSFLYEQGELEPIFILGKHANQKENN
ncbi:DUF1444 family protein [Chryseomicrobium sp. FSL W7-1435]|uniref:DUF1444 family protein n=1 Tax=Chryseomicrobium sp. FSL W7-1435 TaxID=2921704 RepID=UPI00315B3D00